MRQDTKGKVPAWFHALFKFGWVLFALFSLGALITRNWLVAIQMALWSGLLVGLWRTSEPRR